MAARKKKRAKGVVGSRKRTSSVPKTRRHGRSPTLPVVTVQRVVENDARPLFEQAVRPWLTTPWTAHDYGMDAVVDVLKALPDGSYQNTGRRIGIQLKASGADEVTHVSVQVQVRTVRYWLASHDPFAIVFCHVPTRRLVYRWVDDNLVTALTARDAGWFTNESVTIPIPSSNVLSPATLGQFERESRLVVLRRHRVLQPGTYHRLSEAAREAMRNIVACAEAAGFNSVVEQMKDAEERTRKTTYIVALTGRMRAGKSTLFNALVRRRISPVARRPTTAVPVFVMGGNTEEAIVAFMDGRRTVLLPTAEALAEYATQDDNPDNEKDVRVIAVTLVNERLERGIALLDAPGLFDPSPAIRDITARSIASANAVLFVVDVSSARSGGFALEAYPSGHGRC